MAQKTKEQLKKSIEALEDVGLDASEERAQLKQLVLAGTPAPAPAKAEAEAGIPTPTPVEEKKEDFIPLNTESYTTGGGGWTAPATTGVKDGICAGYMLPDFVEDQLWFIFQNPEYPGGDEPFRGALVCGAISKPPGQGGAWKIRDIAIALGIDSEVEVVEGEGIRGLKACEGKECQVLWDDIVLKGKTERRIQDVMASGSEAAM